MPEEEVRLLRRALITGTTACDGGGEIWRACNPGKIAANGIRLTGVVRPRRDVGPRKGNLSVRGALA